jgi:hypothetical protein
MKAPNILRVTSCLRFAVKGKAKSTNRRCVTSINTHVESSNIHLLDLTDDLIVYILSYISTVPFEIQDDNTPLFEDYIKNSTPKSRLHIHFKQLIRQLDFSSQSDRKRIKRGKSKLTFYAFGTITHHLPFVCQRFHSLCNQSDILWKEGMLRLLKIKSSIGWQVALDQWYHRHRVTLHRKEEMNVNLALDNVITASGGGKAAFQSISRYYQTDVFQAPIVFVRNMRPALVLMEPLIIQTFEPRYFLMLFELMHRRHNHERLGNFFLAPRPKFLLSVGMSFPLQIGDPIYVVEVMCCTVREDACAEIFVIPVLKTELQGISERPNSNHLYDAMVLYLPKIPAFSNLSDD